MASLRLVASRGTIDLTFDLLFTPTAGSDEDVAFARAVAVALNTDRLAASDDILPIPTDTDRRGWWADLGAADIWNGWPIGSRLWLMARDKIQDRNAKGGATIERARSFIAEALQPFVDTKICTSFDIQLALRGTDGITGSIKIYRGPKAAISLQYEDLWSVFGA